MKMKTLLFLALFLLNIKVAKSQNWFPMGATYTYSQLFWEYPYTSKSAEWKVTDMLTIKGKLCQKMVLNKGIGVLDKSYYEIFTYADGDVVYWFRPQLDTFTILYDFGKLVGETWEIKGVKGWKYSDTNTCKLVMRVIDKGVDTINGFALRTITIKADNSLGYNKGFDGKVVEFLGHFRTPRPDPFYSCNSVSESSDFFDLRCFNHSDIGFYDFKRYPNCDYEETGIHDVFRRPLIDINPNPSTHFFQIDYQNNHKLRPQFIVNDITGRTIYNGLLSTGFNSINASDWAVGVYFYTLVEDNKITDHGKLMKQ